MFSRSTRRVKENPNFADTLYIDLSNAFDSVNNKILIEKLDNFEIRGGLKLIKSYLQNRTQQVVENGSRGRLIASEKIKVANGAPQGSILGPLLYTGCKVSSGSTEVSQNISNEYLCGPKFYSSGDICNFVNLKKNAIMKFQSKPLGLGL